MDVVGEAAGKVLYGTGPGAHLEATLGDWTADPVGVSRGDRTTSYALALGLMPVAEQSWSQALPRALTEPVGVSALR